MLSKRVIPCLDVMNGFVVKGVKFKNHEIMGSVVDLAQRYCDQGADELVFYDITASSENRSVDLKWVEKISTFIDIPFCIAGGIRSSNIARELLNAGADKISLNSPALENPELITELSKEFGSQCVVVGIDSKIENQENWVYLYTGDEKKMLSSKRKTEDWVIEVEKRGAGEIVLNSMDSDGVGAGYNIEVLSKIRKLISIPLVASGGAQSKNHFLKAFTEADVDAVLAAGVFHRNELSIDELKKYLKLNEIKVRL